jgi:murein DD-endopeptidase MepM/ murein hydrolase activator NlpD
MVYGPLMPPKHFPVATAFLIYAILINFGVHVTSMRLVHSLKNIFRTKSNSHRPLSNSNSTKSAAKNLYQLPIPTESLINMDADSSPVHWGKLENAVDLIAPLNTPVLAAADGVVTYVKDNSNVGGPSESFWDYSNFIAIRHEHNEYTRYDHLATRSSKVKVGDIVKAGQVIANVGMTGYTYLPHLHFQVFVFTGPNVWQDYQTLKVDF